jgi:hypothetical protein
VSIDAGPDAPADTKPEDATMENKNPQQRITLDLPDTEADGVYANFTLISHSPAEFILDFARLVPGRTRSKVHARIIMTPQSAKSLQKSLAANVERFEATHGEIKLAGQPEPDQNIGFKTD